MSLDVYLQGPEYDTACECSKCLNEHKTVTRDTFFEANITHNLSRMAEAAGIYNHLWRPEEIEITQAKQLIEPLEKGLARMRENPDIFRQFNPSNGWGSYDAFVPWISSYLEACRDNPEAFVHASR